jgi:hypothetical protein
MSWRRLCHGAVSSLAPPTASLHFFFRFPSAKAGCTLSGIFFLVCPWQPFNHLPSKYRSRFLCNLRSLFLLLFARFQYSEIAAGKEAAGSLLQGSAPADFHQWFNCLGGSSIPGRDLAWKSCRSNKPCKSAADRADFGSSTRRMALPPKEN